MKKRCVERGQGGIAVGAAIPECFECNEKEFIEKNGIGKRNINIWIEIEEKMISGEVIEYGEFQIQNLKIFYFNIMPCFSGMPDGKPVGIM